MSAPLNDLIRFANGGMDTDSAPEYVNTKDGDYIFAQNMRFTGTGQGQAGYGTNIESTQLIPGSLLPGINNVIGGANFDDTAQIVAFRYNSGGNNQILLYDYTANTYEVIYTDIADSDGQVLLPLNPQNIVKCVLINKTFLIWWAQDLEVGYTNLQTLASGGYGTVLWEDISLLKPQCPIPPTGIYGSDTGQPANYLFGLLPQFNIQYINADFNYSAWSTWSKRIVPYQQNTPTLGSDVTQNNYIIVAVNIGSERASTINIGCRFGADIWNIIKSVDRTHVIALPNTSVNVNNEIYEAYDPATNLYSFVFYNNDVVVPISPNETDLLYDYIWPANAGEKINGNILGLGDWKLLYDRPNTDVTIGAVGYDPNIAIPSGTYPTPLIRTGSNPGSSGSGAGDHRRKMSVSLGGIPHTGDTIIVVLADIRDANNTLTYSYTVPSGQDGNLLAVGGSFSELIPGSNFFDNGDGTVTINFVGPPYFGMQTFSIKLFYEGATVANSIPTILDNSVYQLALAYFDYKSRPFPISTNNNYIITTPSYAQVNGQAVEITWQINSTIAPIGAVGYQWMVTKAPVSTLIDVLGTPLNFKGTWDAATNTTSTSDHLAVNVGTVGDTWQITTPADPSTSGYVNLGNNENYPTGAYVTYNGQAWVVLPKTFGDLTSTGNILAFSLNPLQLFNQEYADEGVSTVLGYDFVQGDRCTLHYYIDGSGNNVYINNPCVNLSVFGYDGGNYIVKVEKPATFDTSILIGQNVFLRLYSPAPQTQTASATQNSTVWFEIGERFTITNGLHDTLKGIIVDGGAYYKTRQYDDALLPYANPPHEVLATDFNYSDFYASEFSSFGRPRSYYDVLEKTEQQASIITSQNYVLGSKVNGLTRFYPANIYGDGNGQTSSSQGAIQIMWQRGDILVIIQQLNTFYIPVNIAYQQLNNALTSVAISEKLLNNGRYDTRGIGIGNAKESFCTRFEKGYFIDPHKSIPMELNVNGIAPISGKMSQYFKDVLQTAYNSGKKLFQFYNDYYEEVVLTIQAVGGILTFYPFKVPDWNPYNPYNISPSDVTATPNGAHCTASWNSSTGIVTYTPTTDYVGGDTATFTFMVDGNPITVNNCLNWTAGSGTVFSFSFLALTDQPLSTLLYSNIISVGGNDYAVPISITAGGEYSINSGSWTSTAATVNNGDNVQVRQTSSASNGTTTTVTLTIDSQSADFNVTTSDEPPPDTVELVPEVTNVDYGDEVIHTDFRLSDILSVDIDITYSISYQQGGVFYIGPQDMDATILASTLTTDDISFPFDNSLGTVTNVTFSYNPAPNPAGGDTIDLTSPQTIVV